MFIFMFSSVVAVVVYTESARTWWNFYFTAFLTIKFREHERERIKIQLDSSLIQ